MSESELHLQLNLFSRPASPTCTGCGRTEAEAPVYVLNDRGRFCMDCQEEAFRWPPAESAGVGTNARPISSSRGGSPYVAGGPDHSKPWRNPALDVGPETAGAEGDER
jgi:hypothetical protein